MTPEQWATLGRLSRYNPDRLHHLELRPFDLPGGYIAVWVDSVYYGIAPDGSASS